MRRLAFALLVGCGGGGDNGSGTTGGSSSSGPSTESTGDSGSMSSTGAPGCDVPPTDCATCWQCAKVGVCESEFHNCASSIECAGSLFCLESMCTPDGITQECSDHCCQNCAEHFTCPLVDTYVTCVEMQCADLCGPATCTG